MCYPKFCIQECTITSEPKYDGSECDLNIRYHIGCHASLKQAARESNKTYSTKARQICTTSAENLHAANEAKSEEVEDLEEVVREEVEEVVVEIANQEDDEEVVNEVVK